MAPMTFRSSDRRAAASSRLGRARAPARIRMRRGGRSAARRRDPRRSRRAGVGVATMLVAALAEIGMLAVAAAWGVERLARLERAVWLGTWPVVGAAALAARCSD